MLDTRGRGYGGKWCCFNLKGGSVDHGEDVGVALGKEEGGKQCPRGHGKNSILEWE
jgi:hypothetical protein